MYKLTHKNCIIQVDGEQVNTIPMEDGNRHYAEYLEWIAEGNSPEPADDELNPTVLEARLWRNTELSRSDTQLLKVQDGVIGLGTQKAWRTYRCDLRDWPSSDNFPEVKPVAPDAK